MLWKYLGINIPADYPLGRISHTMPFNQNTQILPTVEFSPEEASAYKRPEMNLDFDKTPKAATSPILDTILVQWSPEWWWCGLLAPKEEPRGDFGEMNRGTKDLFATKPTTGMSHVNKNKAIQIMISYQLGKHTGGRYLMMCCLRRLSVSEWIFLILHKLKFYF